MSDIDLYIDDSKMKEIGKRISELRKRLGLTQEELAEKGNLTPQFVSSAELGKRAMRSENLYRLANALGVSADYILTGESLDKDFVLLSDKLHQLTDSQLNAVEAIIDELLQK